MAQLDDAAGDLVEDLVAPANSVAQLAVRRGIGATCVPARGYRLGAELMPTRA